MLVRLDTECAASLAHQLDWRAGGLLSLTVDAAEVSAVLHADAWQKLAERFAEARVAGPYRLITFDLALDFAVVGYLAAVTSALAARGVSVYALSAHSRDHILVRRDDAAAARAALEELIAQARRQVDA